MSDFPEKIRDVLTEAWEVVWDFIVEASLWFLFVGGPIAFVLLDLVLHKDLYWTEKVLSILPGKGKSAGKGWP
ncbi:hypothetical protein ACF1BK_25200 [Streptomyces globisporus]|uniref:hypothetical protein n=1 Tax=Streptomyces globisporus TaxID=1908 RepID=UPI0036F5EDEC